MPAKFTRHDFSARIYMLRIIVPAILLFILISCRKDSSSPPPPDEGNPPDTTDTTGNDPDTPVITTRVILDNLSFPWDIFYGPDDHIWMTEKGGRISRVNPETGEVIPLITIDDVVARGEGGLLGIALSLPMDGTSYLFAAYNYQDGDDYKQKIVRYRYSANSLSDPLIIHDDVEGAGIHNGCRLVISKDGKLLATTGDASNTSLPQNFASRNGKVLRMNFDGSIPSDNPDRTSTVWSVGHRNPQGLVYVNDSLFSSEHGPDSDDEINIIHRGGNYGWPNVKGKCEASEETFCFDNNVVEPVVSWTPTIAVSGIDYYNNDLLPQWKNSLLVCTLKDETLYQLELNDSGSEIVKSTKFFNGEFGRLRDVCSAPNGKVYLCTSNGDGDQLIEISN